MDTQPHVDQILVAGEHQRPVGFGAPNGGDRDDVDLIHRPRQPVVQAGASLAGQNLPKAPHHRTFVRLHHVEPRGEIERDQYGQRSR